MDTFRPLIEALHRSQAPCVLAVTGGGATAVAALLAIPGASRSILEATIPYHSAAFTDFLGVAPTQSCSDETSRAMASRAYLRARKYLPGVRVSGIGCTASLATDRAKLGEHRFHVSIHTRLQTTTWSLTFEKGARDRAGEEAILDVVLLNALAETAGIAERLDESLRPGETVLRQCEPATDPLAQLVRCEVDAACQQVDGIWRIDGLRPAAQLSGSFNPLHDGHLRLAEAAERRLNCPVAFEMTLRNADKPPIALEEAERRAAQFLGRRPLWLTMAATFAERACLFPAATWIVGSDTAARIVELRFYGGAAQRDAALAALRDAGHRFLVAGRRDVNGAFVGLRQIDIPALFADLFDEIPEAEFRADISSTQLR